MVWLKTLNLENEDVAHKILPYYFFESNGFERDTLLPYLFCFYHYFVSRDLEVGLKKGEGFLYHCLLQMCFFRVWLPF